MKISVGLLQFRPLLGKSDLNLEAMLPQCQNCDIVVVPELSNSGYNFISRDQAFDTSEDIAAGRFTAMLIRAAEKYNFKIVAGINEMDGNKLYNTSVLVGSEGVLGKYRKIHLFVNEKDFFEPGNLGLPVFDMGDYTLGMQICFDYLFPDTWRILSQKGADLICHPSNLITENAYKTLPGLALTNKIYIATANRIGTEQELTFCGKSIIHDPHGDVMLKLANDKQESAQVTIDLTESRNKMITSRNHIFLDRRPDAYF